MAKFNQSVITSKGRALISKVLNNASTMQFTKLVTGSGSYTGTENLQNALALFKSEQEFSISKITVIDATTVMLQTAITNINLTAGYYIKEIGLYAMDPDEGEILYAVTTAVTNQWDYLPAYEGQNLASISLELYSTVASSSTTSIMVGVGELALAEDVQNLNNKVNSLEMKLSRIYYITLLASNWVGSAAPFTQSVTLEGIKQSDTPFVDIVLSDDNTTAIAEESSYSNISKVTTADGSITVRCNKKKPSVNLNLILKVVG